MTFPNSLENLAFGAEFNQSLELVSLPNTIESLTVDVWCVSGSIKRLGLVTLPSSLQSLNFGRKLNKGLPHVMLPSELLDWTSFFSKIQEKSGAKGIGREPKLHFLYWL